MAGCRVASSMRLAARPVGAARHTVKRLAENTSTKARIIVVLPTPGPPVMMLTFSISANVRAWTWPGAKVMRMRLAAQRIALVVSSGTQRGGVFSRRAICAAIPVSAWNSEARYMAVSSSISVCLPSSSAKASSSTAGGMVSSCSAVASNSARGQ